jgi:hypothetical protein
MTLTNDRVGGDFRPKETGRVGSNCLTWVGGEGSETHFGQKDTS